MALSQNTYVYMEAVEEIENKNKKSVENGSSYGTCMAGRKQPSRSLVHNTYSCRQLLKPPCTAIGILEGFFPMFG